MKRLIYLLLLFIPFLNYGQTNSFDVTKGTIRSHLRMVPNASPPSNVLIGTLYFDTDTNYYWFDGVQWQQFGGGDIYWTLSGDTLGTSYNVRLDSSFLMQAGKWHIGYAKEDQHDDNADSLVYLGYCDYNNTGKVSTIEVRKNDSDTNYYIYMYARSNKGSTQYTQTDSTIVINSENIYMPDITSDGGKFEYLVGLDPNGRLFPQPLASAYDNIIERAIDSGYYGKENIKDVGSVSEIYSDFSTAVAAASAGDVIELSNATFTETGTVTMPTGSTLKIYEGGLLSGTFTLVGDNTRLDAGLYQCFGSGVTITGTWIVDKTYVDWFGMVGAADEGGELTAAINFCKLTTGKTLVFQSRTYYVENFITYWAGGGTIEGNNAVIKITYNSATEYEEALRIYGSVGTYDTLAVDAVFGSYILDVPAGSALLSLNRGDMVKIISDASPDGTTNLHGEIKIVDTVIAAGRNVKFTEPLYSTYYAADNARMAELTMGKAVIKDLTIIGLPGRNYNLGIELKYIDKPIIENVKLENFKYSAFGLQDCYAGRFDVVANNAVGSTGLGYGVVLYGASMNNVVTIRGFSMRHITATGGNGSQGGIPYNNLFVDCIGTGVATHAFDMHPACGTGNKYINCRASAGVAIADTANFQGEWASTVTYDNNDIISIYSSDTSGYQLYRSVQNSNTNHSPNTDLGAYWEVYDNAFNGFGILCSDVEIINCEVTGFSSGLLLNNRVHRNIKVDGLTINNGTYGVFLENDTVINSSFTNIYHKNEAFMDDAYTIVLSGSTLNSVDFDNIYSTNATAFLVQTSTITQKTLHCGNIFSDILLIAGIQSNEIHIDFDNVVNRAKSNPANCIYLPTTANGIKSINIDDWTVYNPVTAVIGNNAHINSLSIGNARLVDGNTVNFIDNNDSIDRIYIGYIYNDGSGALDILDNTGGYCSEFVVENMAGTLQAVPWLKGNAVATQFIKWGAAVDVIDFKAAGQYSGWIKQGGQTLINTYGSGNVGLGYKALTQQGALTYVGTANTAVGCESLWNLSITSGGTRNAAFGYNSGRAMSTGTDNTLHGAYAGRAISTGIGNTVIGSYAGYSLGAGSDYNVLIGFNAGYNETGSNKLYIDNTNTATPLIGGDFSTDAVTITGSCSITTFLKLTPTADPPASAAEGMIYADTDHHIYYYNGSTWVQLDN